MKLGMLGVGVALACAIGCKDEISDANPVEPPTYWADVAPLFAARCAGCHRDGGIAPFRLDDYAVTKEYAGLIEHVTRERTMPPWSVTSDGSCGEFLDSEALSDAQIARIEDWVQAGAPEGEPRRIEQRAPPTLADATELLTPLFVPEAEGGELAAYDEYRCFVLDAAIDSRTFITGYEVLPGRPEIVHHLALLIVDPDAPAEVREAPDRTNREQLQALDDDTPDRAGWPCYGAAGEGLNVESNPVIWAPGQGVVEYPGDSGVPGQSRSDTPALARRLERAECRHLLARGSPARHARGRSAHAAAARSTLYDVRMDARCGAARSARSVRTEIVRSDASYARVGAQVPHDSRRRVRGRRAALGLPLATHVLLRAAVRVRSGFEHLGHVRLRHVGRSRAGATWLEHAERDVPRDALLHGPTRCVRAALDVTRRGAA
jgi:hypothetical protein